MMPLFLSEQAVGALFVAGLLVLMVILVIRAVRGLDEQELDPEARPGVIQRVVEALLGPKV